MAVRRKEGEQPVTRDDIIRMAREAGAVFPADGSYHCFEVPGTLERFAALVAAAEREACAKVCDQFIDEMQKVLPVEKLRETDPYKAFYKANAARIIQDTIRARGQA